MENRDGEEPVEGETDGVEGSATEPEDNSDKKDIDAKMWDSFVIQISTICKISNGHTHYKLTCCEGISSLSYVLKTIIIPWVSSDIGQYI